MVQHGTYFLCELKHGVRLVSLKCIHTGLGAHLNIVCRRQWHGYVKHHLIGYSDGSYGQVPQERLVMGCVRTCGALRNPRRHAQVDPHPSGPQDPVDQFGRKALSPTCP